MSGGLFTEVESADGGVGGCVMVCGCASAQFATNIATFPRSRRQNSDAFALEWRAINTSVSSTPFPTHGRQFTVQTRRRHGHADLPVALTHHSQLLDQGARYQ